MTSHRSRLSRHVAVALVGIAALASAFDLPASAGDATPPARSDCNYDTQQWVRPEQRWRQLTRTAELVTADAGTARRRPTRPGETADPIPRRNLVDEEIFGAMDAADVVPTRLTTDEEFIRRVTLDLTGDIPTAARVKSFLADTRGDKRDRLVDELLASEAFVNRWTIWFGDLVQNVVTSNNSRLYATGRNAYYNWIRDAIRSGKPYDLMVRELVAGTGDSYVSGPPNYAVRQIQRNGPIQDTYDNLAARSVEKFMGMPFECISCHNGPGHLDQVNSYLTGKQRRDFWETAAFFSRTTIQAVRVSDDPPAFKFTVTDDSRGGYLLNTTTGNKTPRQPEPGEADLVTPTFILGDGGVSGGESYRAAFARQLTSDRQFSRAAVNYLWKELFHLGIVEPVDAFDLNRLDPAKLPAGWTTQPSHPVLLERLAESFEDGNYDLRATLRLMVTSSAYQLATEYTPGNWSETNAPYFARHYPQRVMAEALLDSVCTATQIAPTFNVEGLGALSDAVALPDPLTPNQRNPLAKFMSSFGRGDRDQNKRTYEGSILQALGMMNDKVVTDRVENAARGSTVERTLSAGNDDATVVDEIYLATLSRHPTPDERAEAIAKMKGTSRVSATEDLQFVLLNRLEFLFN